METWHNIPGTLSKLYSTDSHDDIAIHKLFAAWVENMNSGNVSQLMKLYSPNFLNLAETKSDMQTFLNGQMPTGSTVSVQLEPEDISVEGLKAYVDFQATIVINGQTVLQSWVNSGVNDNNTNNDVLGITGLHKESGKWRFYGDQQSYPVVMFSQHLQGATASEDSYISQASVELPYGDSLATGTITGPGASTGAAMNLQSSGSQWFPGYLTASVGLTNPPPTPPLDYTIQVSDSNGMSNLQGTVTAYVADFATPETPTAGMTLAGGTPSFTWETSSESGLTYGVGIYDSTGVYQQYSDSYASSPDSPFANDGWAALSAGTYTWKVIATDGAGNQSLTAPWSFIVPLPTSSK
jgi:hypothetical protein